MTKKTVIFASTNRGKFNEFQKLIKLDPEEFNIYSLNDLGYNVPECEETGKTFKENAVLKVRHTYEHLRPEHKQTIIIGDDSGMSIAALGGEPGVHTRRWAGHRMTDDEIISYCLKQLENISNRSADYVTAYALLAPFVVEPYVIQHATQGTILETPRKESYAKGVPFRSLFYIPEVSLMFHDARELPKDKRKVTHIGHEVALHECKLFIESVSKLLDVGKVLKKSWSASTSYWQERWLADNPSFVQCAVSALIIQDGFGGEIIRCNAWYNDSEAGHFYNKISNGLEVDLTRDQFPKGTLYAYKRIAKRAEVLSASNTVRRYKELKQSVEVYSAI